MPRTLYLCGAGNSEGVRLALGINRAKRRWQEIVLLDDDATKHGRSILGVEVVGPFDVLEKAEPGRSEVACLVARTTAKRWAANERIAQYGVPFATLVHPTVDVLGAELAAGVILYQNACVGPEVVLGADSVVFMGAAVGHESRVGSGCVVAPGAVVNARVRLGDGVYVGTNASVLPEITIGAWATVAAGSVAMRHVPAGATVLGVPGKILEFHPRTPAGDGAGRG